MFHNWTHTSGFFDTAKPGTAAAGGGGRNRHARLARAGRAPLWSNDTAVRWERTLPSWVPLFGGAGFDTSDGGKYPDEKYDTVGIPIQFGKTSPGIYTNLNLASVSAVASSGLMEKAEDESETRRTNAPDNIVWDTPIFNLVDRLVSSLDEIKDLTTADQNRLIEIIQARIDETDVFDFISENASSQTAYEYGEVYLKTKYQSSAHKQAKNWVKTWLLTPLKKKTTALQRQQKRDETEKAKKQERDEMEKAIQKARKDNDLALAKKATSDSARFVSSLVATGPPTLCFIANGAVYACSGSPQSVDYVTGTDAVVQKLNDDRDKGHFFVFLGAFGTYTIDSLKEDVNLGPGQFFNPDMIEDLKANTRRAYTVTNIIRMYEWALARVAQGNEISDTLERLSRIPSLNRVQVYVGSA
jgi:hypothetical protein